DAENGRVGADAKRKRHNHGDRQALDAGERPKGKAEIGEKAHMLFCRTTGREIDNDRRLYAVYRRGRSEIQRAGRRRAGRAQTTGRREVSRAPAIWPSTRSVARSSFRSSSLNARLSVRLISLSNSNTRCRKRSRSSSAS